MHQTLTLGLTTLIYNFPNFEMMIDFDGICELQ
jgi:hypothetical protein